MNRKWILAALVAALFILSFLILFDQYRRNGLWFQTEDIHHETLALISFALGIGILLGAIVRGKEGKFKKMPQKTYFY